jgi:hypothetical protein
LQEHFSYSLWRYMGKFLHASCFIKFYLVYLLFYNEKQATKFTAPEYTYRSTGIDWYSLFFRFSDLISTKS